MVDYCDRTGTISRSTMGAAHTDLRHRIGYTSGGQGTHTGTQAVTIRSGFYDQCEEWSAALNWLTQELGLERLDWIGEVGVLGHCEENSSSWHHSARAFDITRIDLAGTYFVDTNWSWRQGPGHVRRYLAIACVTRYYFDTVLTAWWNSDHHNHIHFDNGTTPVGPLTSSRSDTVIVQAACQLIDGSTIARDGVWGTQTTAAVNRLRDRIAPGASNIRGNLDDTRYLLIRIASYGLLNLTT